MAAGGFFPLDPFLGGMPPELAQLFDLQAQPRPVPPDPGAQLLAAAEAGDAEQVAELLASSGLHPDQAVSDLGHSALSRAAYKVWCYWSCQRHVWQLALQPGVLRTPAAVRRGCTATAAASPDHYMRNRFPSIRLAAGARSSGVPAAGRWSKP